MTFCLACGNGIKEKVNCIFFGRSEELANSGNLNKETDFNQMAKMIKTYNKKETMDYSVASSTIKIKPLILKQLEVDTSSTRNQRSSTLAAISKSLDFEAEKPFFSSRPVQPSNRPLSPPSRINPTSSINHSSPLHIKSPSRNLQLRDIQFQVAKKVTVRPESQKITNPNTLVAIKNLKNKKISENFNN